MLPASGTTVFTSTIRIAATSRRSPTTSTEPRSLPTENENFDRRFPAGCLQQCHDAVDDAGMGGIEQTIEALPMPPQQQLDVGTDRIGDPADRPDRHPVDVPRLDPRDDLPRDLGLAADVILSLVHPQTQCTHRSPEPQPVHRDIVRADGHRRLMRAVPSPR